MSNTPTTTALIEEAANYRGGEAAWGDGTLLDGILKLMEQLMPFILNCMPSKAAFVDTAQDPTWGQQRRLLGKARRLSRRLPGLTWRERRIAAEEAVTGMMAVGETAAEERLEACYDELT